MTRAEFDALRKLYDRLMKAYNEGDDQAAMVITYLAATIAAAQLWRKELQSGAAP